MEIGQLTLACAAGRLERLEILTASVWDESAMFEDLSIVLRVLSGAHFRNQFLRSYSFRRVFLLQRYRLLSWLALKPKQILARAAIDEVFLPEQVLRLARLLNLLPIDFLHR